MTDLESTPAIDRRTVRRLALAAVFVAGLLVAAGWWAWQRTAPDRRAKTLFHTSVVMAGQPGRPLTDDEFEEALALAAGGRPACRWPALIAAAVRTRGREDRRARVERLAAVRLDSPDLREQAHGLCALRMIERAAYLPQARRLKATATDPRLRVESTHAVAEFERTLGDALLASR